MAYQIFITSNGKRTELTPIVGQISWSDSIDELGQKFSFTVPMISYTPYFPRFDMALSDTITLINDGKIIFWGYVFEILNEEKVRTITCYDPLFYLNKSKTTIQFKGDKTATACINQLLTPFKIPTQSVAKMNTKIKKIYNDQAYSEILKDILNQAKREIGEDYRFQMEYGKIVIDRQYAFLINTSLELFQGIGKFDSLSFISNPQRRVSITDTKNSIVITKDDQVYTSIADAASIGKYGLLQETISFDGNTLADAKKQALSALHELNKVNEEVSFDLPGDDIVRSGRVLKINETKTGIVGQFIITATNHTVTNGIHKMNLSLKRY